MSSIEELSEYFKKFPGVGPKQAGRFSYYIVKQNPNFVKDFTNKLLETKNNSVCCDKCFKFFETNSNHADNKTCSICKNQNRDQTQIMIVSQDVDINIIEKSSAYNGQYFVLGCNVPIMFDNPEKIIRLNELNHRIANGQDIKEIIIALNANPEGENTSNIIKKNLAELAASKNIKFSILGRGLSTGSEIEYSDTETIKNALKNRF